MSSTTKERKPRSIHEEEALGKAYDARLAKRLWKYLSPYRGLVWRSILLMAPLTFLHLVQPVIVKEALDQDIVPKSGTLGGLAVWAVLFLGALSFEYLFRYWQLYTMQQLGQHAMHDLRVDTFRHVQSLPIRFFHRTPAGRLLTRMTTDVEALNEMFASGIVSIVGDLVTLVVIVVILFVLSPRLALTTLAVAPLVAVIAYVFRSVAREAFRKIRVKIARINAYLSESIYGIREIQSFTREKHNLEEFSGINEDHRRANNRSILADAMLFAIVELLAASATAAVLWQGGLGIGEGAVSFGTLVAFLDYIAKFFTPVRDLSAKFTIMQSGMAAAERIFGLHDEKPTLVAPARPKTIENEHGISFEDVSFAYVEDDLVLKNLSFTIAPGERVAVVGATGAGKSTLVNLLLRLYDTRSGVVRVGGVDVREVSPSDLRRFFAVVHQDVFLFSGDVFTNLTLGDDAVSEQRALDAANAVGLAPLLARLEGGLHAEVRERGGNFSTGEKQLLSFARALARDPAVLILDEATSSVDPESEQRLEAATRVLLEGRTSVVIAHRLTTIQHVDRILVLHRGCLVESGTHDELIALDGRYARLYQLQFEG